MAGIFLTRLRTLGEVRLPPEMHGVILIISNEDIYFSAYYLDRLNFRLLFYFGQQLNPFCQTNEVIGDVELIELFLARLKLGLKKGKPLITILIRFIQARKPGSVSQTDDDFLTVLTDDLGGVSGRMTDSSSESGQTSSWSENVEMMPF